MKILKSSTVVLLLLFVTIFLFSCATDSSATDFMPTTDDFNYADAVPTLGDSFKNYTVDTEFVYEQARLLNIQLNAAAEFHGYLANEEREELNLLFLHSTEFDDIPVQKRFYSYAGVYMLDMDTGIWYDSSFIDWSSIIPGSELDCISDRKTALIRAFDLYGQQVDFDCNLIELTEVSLEDIEDINMRVMLDTLMQEGKLYPYANIGEEQRILSDEEIQALYMRPAGFVRSVISTIPDAIAYLDMRFPSLMMGLSVFYSPDTHSRWLRGAYEVLYCSENASASRACIVNCVTYLLCDDYEIESLVAFWPDPNVLGKSGPEKAINAIKTADGYLFFDPVLRMQGDAMSRFGDLLPEMTCSSIAEYIEHIRQSPHLSSVIKYIFTNSGGVKMNFLQTFSTGFTIVTDSPGIEMVYYNLPSQEPGQHIVPENIDKYMLSTILGGVTLTPEEAYSLVDASPEVVQEKVKTAADVLMYMLASRMIEGVGCYCTDIDGQTWHWNMDAKTFMQDRRAGCGQCANLGRFLLDGDYEEIGFVDHTYYPGGGGGHVYNYIVYEGKYYIVDFSSYFFSGYEPTSDFKVPVLNSLEEWGEKIHHYYRNVCLSLTYRNHRGFPCVYGEDNSFYLPDTAEYTILYDAGDGFRLEQLPFDTSVYDWNIFWE